MEFGDYEREVAQAELDDLKYHAVRGTKRNFKIHKLPDASARAINKFMVELNTKP